MYEKTLIKEYEHKKGHTTKWFISLFLLAGICNFFSRSNSRFLNALMFIGNSMIYVGLILFWIQTVRNRLLPTKARKYMTTAALFMVIYLLIRVFKYRVVISDFVMIRYSDYSYFIPLLIIPTLLLMTAIRLGRGETGKYTWDERLLLLPAIGFSIAAITNDLHFLVYRPKVDLSMLNMNVGTYSWGFLFYINYAWIILTLTLGILILLRITRKKKRLALILPLIIIAWISLDLYILLVVSKSHLPRMYLTPEINVFMLLLIYEFCIRTRLIPFNENYIRSFHILDIPILVTDPELNPVFETGASMTFSKDDLFSCRKEPFYPSEDIRLSSMQIHSGYAFWTEDESELHKERRRLESANEILSEENDLIKKENELKEKMAHLDAQNQVYERIAKTIYPTQKKIEALLESEEPGTEAFRDALAKACVLNAYSKRKSNLLLIDEKTLPMSNRELFLALAETARFLRCLGIEAAAIGEEYSEISLPSVHDLYDSFEAVIEQYLPYMKRMTVSLMRNGIRLAMENREDTDLPKTILPIEKKMSDEITYLTIHLRQGGDAA